MWAKHLHSYNDEGLWESLFKKPVQGFFCFWNSHKYIDLARVKSEAPV